ncbi:MAG: hypothetical protein K2X27_27710 [Candidatus Obscuribacterales bacterium]|nr:hypothetical protein [Candidatus Obscuribacterales bacterium]
MRNISLLSAEQVLSVQSPEMLFSRSSVEAKQEYRALASRFHPDSSKTEDATAVFTHIVQLYKEAQQKLKDGNWEEPYQKIEEEEPGIRKFARENGCIESIRYQSLRQFELGNMYIDEHRVSFEIRNEFSDLFHKARRQMREFQFSNESMAAEITRCLPLIEDSFVTKNAGIICIRKTPDQLLLADVLKHHHNRIEPIEHIGWIINNLWNIASYLEWAKLTHNAISAETVFISPLRHSAMLLGGWCYATRIGERLEALPDRSMKFMPTDILLQKKADPRADIELIKALACELLGHQQTNSLRTDKSIPRHMSEWLHRAAPDNARAAYREWKYEVLEDCFGSPSFIPMKLESRDLYKEI